MFELAQFFVAAVGTLFVVVDPIPVVPIYSGLSRGLSDDESKQVVRRASVAGALLLVTFALVGQRLFQVLGLELGAFRVAGGLLLLLTALDMLRGEVSTCRCNSAELDDSRTGDLAIVPLATPLLAGPGSIATVLLLGSDIDLSRTAALILAIVVVFAASYLVLRSARWVERVLRPAGVALVQRVFGLLLAASAVQMIATGGRALLS